MKEYKQPLPLLDEDFDAEYDMIEALSLQMELTVTNHHFYQNI